jgi:hypothetical protein
MNRALGPAERGGDTPSALALLGRGAVVGIAGSIVVAVLQGVTDLALGRPLFHTPGVLGLGIAGLPGVIAAGSDVLRFTAVHVLVFIVVGALLALASGASDRPRHLGAAGVVFLAVFFGSATMAEAWDPQHAALPSWSIAICNVAALVVMGWLLRVGAAGDR